MQPENHRSKLWKAAVSRGRMYLKSHLGFFPGFPLREADGNVIWLPLGGLGAEDEIRLSADRVRQATYGWNTLLNRFPRSLPRILDNAESWTRAVPKILDALGRSIRHQSALANRLFDLEYGYPPATARAAARLVVKHPDLRDVLDAMSWALALSPDRAPGAISWLERNSASVNHLLRNLKGSAGLGATLLLWDLARSDGDRRTHALMATLGCPDAFVTATSGGVEHIEAWTRGLSQIAIGRSPSKWSEPRPPSPLLAASVFKFLKQLRCQPPKTRRRSLELLSLILPRDLLARWRAWWHEVQPATVAARRLIVKAVAGAQVQGREEARTLAGQLASAAMRVPPELPENDLCHGPEGMFRALGRLSSPDDEALCDELLSILRVVEAESAAGLLRGEMLVEVVRWLDAYPVDRVLRTLRALRSSRIPTGRLHEVVVDYDFSEILEDGVHLDRACQAIAAWLGQLGQTGHLVWPVSVSRWTEDVERSHSYLRELASRRAGTDNIDPAPLQCVVQLGPQTDLFVPLLQQLQRAYSRSPGICDSVRSVAERLKGTELARLTVEAVLCGDFRVLRAVAMRVDLLRSLGKTAEAPRYPAPVAPPAWAARYPSALHDSLARLSCLIGEAQQSAANLLKADFPARKNLLREIESIEARMAASPSDSRLARRLENLRLRLREPHSVPVSRLERLDLKLRHAIRRRLFDAWQEHLQAQVEQSVSELLGVGRYPEWLRDERHQQALIAVLGLDGWARDLGVRLLRVRCDPPPWNLEQDSANQKFVSHVRSLGVDPDPWINPPGPTIVAGRNGRKLQLVFERDPLEILQMGAYFQTCLSPGAVNFFSAVANAADLNKHVVFARDDAGRVMGRCLLALEENGGLLAFHPYCHDRGLGFERMIAEVLADLAVRMRTVVVQRGRVPTLVARGWYDDGPRDLGNRFPCLEEQSPLRAALPTIGLSAVVPLVEAAIAPLPLSALIIPLLLELPEFQSRPDLVVPLLRIIMRAGALTLDTVIRAAELAKQAGEFQAARRLLQTRAIATLARECRRYPGSVIRRLRTIAEIDPSAVLRVLRSSRPRGVQKDEQEVDRERRRILSVAHAALGRPGKARRLLPEKER